MVLVAPDDLSVAERSLWEAFPCGGWLDLRPDSPSGQIGGPGIYSDAERVIRAETIAALLLGAREPAAGCHPAIRLRGVQVTGRLDLMGATVSYALVCEHCRFDEPIRLVEATTKTVRIVDSQLPGFNGARMRVDGILNFHHSEVAAVLRLEGARISGELCLDHATLGSGTGDIVLAAENLIVDGPLNCRGIISRGAISLRGAHISGTIDATDAKIPSGTPKALDANYAFIGGRFLGNGMAVEGEIRLRHARIGGSLDLAGARLHNPSGHSLGCGGAAIEGGVWCVKGFEAEGQLRFIGARMGGNLTLAGAKLSNPGGIAVNLDRATLADLDCTGLEVREGQITLAGTQVASQVTLTGAQLTATPGHPALTAEGCSVGGTVALTQMRVHGEVSMWTSHIGGRLQLADTSIDNPGGVALRVSRTEINADMFCDRMTLTGGMKLARTRIGGHADLRQVTLINPGGIALGGVALQAAEFSLLPAKPVAGTVNFSHAKFGVLRDDPACWPAELKLEGLTYDLLQPHLPARRRLEWLTAGTERHQVQPYEELAALYSRLGQMAEARRVLHAKERHQRATKTAIGRAWGILQDITIGYGYQPWLAALWFAVLLAAGSAIFAVGKTPPHTSGAPPFNPVIYTLDLLLPIISLGQKNYFNPTGLAQWLAYVLMAAGWLLASTIVTAIARVIRRQ